MGRLDKLLKELCPNGVEYKKLGDVATISRGGSFQKKDFCESGVPCIHYGQIYTKYAMFPTETFTFIDSKVAEKQKFAEPGDIVMAVTSENIEDICKCIAWLGNEKAAISGHSAIIHHNLNPKYLVYYLHSAMFYQQKTKLAHGTKVMEVRPDDLKGIRLPVPPLEVQCEIVRVLDSFTLLTDELTDELTARKKQYEYYRDLLLSPKEGKNCELGDVVKIKNGRDYKHLGEGIYPVYGSGGVMKYVNDFTYDKPTVLIPRKGSIDKLYYVEQPFWNVDTVFYTEIDESKAVPKFLFYLLQMEHLEQYNTAGGVPSLTQGVLNKIKIYVPSLEEQNKIVNMLDKYDLICNDISKGIPAEIEARKKQYEYYRDKLLSFKELGA